MFRTSGYFFVGLLGLTLLAFWQTYVSRLPGDFDRFTHVHAALMLAWFGLLIAQPLLIRAERRRLHRALGALSYGLVPAIVVVTLLLTHVRITALPPERFAAEASGYYLPPGMMALFLVAYVLAIVYRKTAALHARYMICTSLALVDPIVARILYVYFPRLPDGRYAQLVSYLVTVGALAALIYGERRQRAGRAAFPVMLATTTILYGLFFTWAQSESWVDVARWFRDLPLT